ncbi:MAG: NADH-quinone oxidoreductase subunit H [Candidatus Thermoplasmatota archaeon]|nr:NADH-quinone oxidoreductase subunit H [Candidatus Thermoplasmatota archaeon]MDD5778412.1 NADH-quinone oxidoreductase subunit H [Candidatus Thermoplasmatota archaeon]
MNAELFFQAVMGTAGITFVAIFLGLSFKGLDRKIAAHMQMRIGPPLRQPFWDVGKLLVKDSVVPENAVSWMYHLAPVICLASSVTLLLYIPLAGWEPLLAGHGDLILVLYLLTLPALSMVAGGFASGSPFATVGAQREMVTMMSYEFPLAVAVIAVVWKISDSFAGDVFTLEFISSHPIWAEVGLLGAVGVILILLSLLIVLPAELSKIPFDVAEAETEIAEGVLVDYSGRNLALFYLADGVKTFALASLVVVIFFPYQLTEFVALGGLLGDAANLLFFLLKVSLVMLFAVTMVRVSVARLRISEVVSTYWVAITLMALLGLVLLMWDSQVLTIKWW